MAYIALCERSATSIQKKFRVYVWVSATAG